MAFPRLPAPMLLVSFILLLYWTTSSAGSHDPTSADLSPPYRVKRDLPVSTRERVAASSQVVIESLTVVKEVIGKMDPEKLKSVMKTLADFASLAPGIGALVSSVLNVVLAFIPQEDAQKELFAEVNRKLDSLSIQISNLATDVEWFNYASVYSQDEVRILTAWNKFNEFRKNSALADNERAKVRLAKVFTSYYENTATEASVANLYLYLTVSSTSLSGNLNELLKKKFKCGIPEIGKYNLYFSSLLWKGMVLNQVYWNLIGLNPSGKEEEHTQMFKNVYRAQISAVWFCLDNYKQYMIKDVEEISKANSPDNKQNIADQVKNKLDQKYNWYKWVVLVYNSNQETYHILYDMTKIPVGEITVAVANIQKEELYADFERTADRCFSGIGCKQVPNKIKQCYFKNYKLTEYVKITDATQGQDFVVVPKPFYKVTCNWAFSTSEIHMYLSQRKSYICKNNPCVNGGTCKRLLDTNEHLCECPDGFHGDRCELKIRISKPEMINTNRPVPDINTIDTKLKMLESKLE